MFAVLVGEYIHCCTQCYVIYIRTWLILNTFTSNKEKQYLVLVNNVQPYAATLGHNVFGYKFVLSLRAKVLATKH